MGFALGVNVIKTTCSGMFATIVNSCFGAADLSIYHIFSSYGGGDLSSSFEIGHSSNAAYGSLAFIASYILAVTFARYIKVSITNYFGILYNRRKECLLLVANLPKKIILCLLSQRCQTPEI